MTAYILTPEQHAQIVDALELPSLKTVSMLIKRDAALAMLKAMKPVEPCGFAYEHQDYIGSVIGAAGEWAPNEIPLYTFGDTA